MTRKMTREKFAKIEEWGERFTHFRHPVYQEFLAGKRELTCTAWAIPTRNIRGWKAPCYLMTDGHYPAIRRCWRRWIGKNTAWSMAWRATPAARIAWSIAATIPAGRCAPTRATTGRICGTNFGAKPKPYYEGRSVKAFNGVSIGKGHLAEAKAAINAAGGSCGTGDTSQRDELLSRIAETRTRRTGARG